MAANSRAKRAAPTSPAKPKPRSRATTAPAARTTPARTASPKAPASKTRTARAQLPGSRSVRKRPPRGVLVSLVVVGVIAFSIWSFYPVARVQYREERQNAKLQAELAALKARNARLSKEVARLRTPEGVEDVARANLGLVKEGEHAVVVVDPTKESTITTAPTIDREPEVSAPRGPWTAALDAFFGYHE